MENSKEVTRHGITRKIVTRKVPRGTARRARRQAWASIARRVEKPVVKEVWNEDQKRLVPTAVKAVIWEPSFAEWTARQQRR